MSKIDRRSDNNSATPSKIKYLVGVLIAIIIILIIAVAYFIFNNKYSSSEPKRDIVVNSGRGVLATPDNVKDIIEDSQKNTDDNYTVSMNIDWNFKDGTSTSSNAYVENDISNSRMVYFDVILQSSNEIVYSSPFIPVGSTLTDFALVKDLDAGNYLATVVYHLVDDDKNELSTVSVATTLHILN